MEKLHTLYLVSPGLRPSFSSVAFHLWPDSDFDSDGNCETPGDRNWTELTITRRHVLKERVDIDPVSEKPLVLKVVSESPQLVERTVQFLAAQTLGTISREWPSA